jgi:hypothetical protein
VPVCQNIPADTVDPHIVAAFFQALSPVELDAYAGAVAAQQAEQKQVSHAHQQQVERLRYEAALAQRQFLRVDPDNRLVAAELERRWEATLTELKRAEEASACSEVPSASLLSLSPELQTTFKAIGQHLPTLWQQKLIKQQHKKALLRCLIDKVVLHRPTPEWVQARIVWRGGQITTLQIPVPVGSLKDLAGAEEMERLILQRSAEAGNRRGDRRGTHGEGLSLAYAPVRLAKHRPNHSLAAWAVPGAQSVPSSACDWCAHDLSACQSP